jgi:hypothetical protein
MVIEIEHRSYERFSTAAQAVVQESGWTELISRTRSKDEAHIGL